jgi:valyl-tRNA synthetase
MDPEVKPKGQSSQSFQPQQFEDDIYAFWEKGGYFTPDPKSNAKPFAICKPPPNLTGALHMGHALTDTIEDAIVRFKRMKGFKTLFIPGTDHASIATHVVVERELAKEGKNKHDLGREKFLERMWEVKERHHAIITKQMKKLGGSLDWSRECFTLDPKVKKAVKKVFVQLYEEGLIYRGKRLISWCPKDQTALSDLEVEQKETKGSLWSVKYFLKEDPTQFIVVATTRPETIFADQAIAVHSDDDRYQKWLGKLVKVPGTDRFVPIIKDDYVDPKFGSGALKITPGHDFNDYEIGKRHKLAETMVIDAKGVMTFEAGQFKGQAAKVCRKNFSAWLEQEGFIESIKDHQHYVGQCQRCGTVAEPLLSEQWFVKIKPLADPAAQVVRDGKIEFVPENWTKTYFEWMDNIRDWCVSRQLWWGHQIPAYYCGDCTHVMVSETDLTVCEKCQSKKVTQDQDILDTWFSSGLWPLVTLGWPDDTDDLKTYYPNQLMETGFDIIFFWVARMIMFGLKFGKQIPFEKVFFHAMVRDEHGHKMSKTRGNVIDPLDIIKAYGADALRFTLGSMAGQGRDIKLSLERVSGYRNFMNKIWNARRFLEMNLAKPEDITPFEYDDLHWANRWIIAELSRVTENVTKSYDRMNLTDASQGVYDFFWHEYCDWYVEFSKVLYQDPKLKSQSLWVGFWVFREAIKLLHPLSPFITEKLFQGLPESMKDADAIIISAFPTGHPGKIDKKSCDLVNALKSIVGTTRRLRSLSGIPPGKKVGLYLDINLKLPEEEVTSFIKSLTRSNSISFGTKGEKSFLKGATPFGTIYVDPAGSIDVAKELSRIKKDLSFVEKGKLAIGKKLSNQKFIQNAPQEVVDEEKQKLEDLESKETLLKDMIRSLE